MHHQGPVLRVSPTLCMQQAQLTNDSRIEGPRTAWKLVFRLRALIATSLSRVTVQRATDLKLLPRWVYTLICILRLWKLTCVWSMLQLRLFNQGLWWSKVWRDGAWLVRQCKVYSLAAASQAFSNHKILWISWGQQAESADTCSCVKQLQLMLCMIYMPCFHFIHI